MKIRIRRLKRGLILMNLLIGLSLLPSHANGSIHYVDKDASGNNDGSSWPDAWERFADINWSIIQPGDTIYISGGPSGGSKTYYETLNVRKSGSKGNPIVITVDINNPSHNGEVIIDGENQRNVGIQLADWVTVDGKDNGYVYPHKGEDDYNIKIKDFLEASVKGDGTSVGNIVQYVECTGGGTANTPRAIKLWGGYYNKANYNYVHHVGSTGISFTGTQASYGSYNGWKIGDNEAGYNYIEWVGLNSTTDGITFRDGAWAHHNRIDHSGRPGTERAHRDAIVIQGSHGLIEYNIISDFGQQIYVNCLWTDYDGDNHFRDIIIRNNIVYTSDNSVPWGIAFAIAGQMGAIVDEVKVYNNTFIGMKGNYILIDGGIGDEIEIKNNIFYVPQANNAIIRGSREADPIFDYNIHYGPKINWYGTIYSFSQFQSATGQEQHGLNSNPLLIDPSVGDDTYDAHLQSKSPAIDAGVDVGLPYRGSAPDIGAYEYSGLPPVDNTPYTSEHNPAKGATDVPIGSNIVVHVRDNGAGVDESSIVMTVEGVQVTPTITGSPADYTLTYDPPTDFDYNQVVNVTIDAQDLANPPNVMPQDSYSFTTESRDTIPPTVTSVFASNAITVEVLFSEPVEQASAEDTGNYIIDHGISITSATLDADLKTVRLLTTDHSEGITYTIMISNVTDLAGNPVAPNSTKLYTYTLTVKIWLEAEEGMLISPMRVETDAAASEGNYIYVPSDGGDQGLAEYTITIPAAGDYIIWGRVLAPTDGNNSFFVSIDNGPDQIWDCLYEGQSSEWTWDQVTVRGNGTWDNPQFDPAIFTLSVGTHTLRIREREAGTKIDKLLLTTDVNYVPTGKGDLHSSTNQDGAMNTKPTTWSLSQNYPNPFNSQTEITYEVPITEQVRLIIYNMLGQVVTTLVDNVKGAGRYTIYWDGMDVGGNKVMSGIYFYRLNAGRFSLAKKMIFLK